MAKNLTKARRISAGQGVVLGLADGKLSRRLVREVERLAMVNLVSAVSSLGQLRENSARRAPRAILVDDALLAGAPVFETLRELGEIAPVIFLAPLEHQTEIARLAGEGEVEFVAKQGDFIPLAASLIVRRLRLSERSEFAVGPPWAEFSGDLAEIFRHEINNPLTGILGNAELLLAHRDRMPAGDTARLQTVVDLAVRLRETVRKLSDAWEQQPTP